MIVLLPESLATLDHLGKFRKLLKDAGVKAPILLSDYLGREALSRHIDIL